MKVLVLISIIIIIFSITTYDKWSRKKWAERCEVNALHPDWTPACGRNFFKEDPEWFMDNGYKEYID